MGAAVAGGKNAVENNFLNEYVGINSNSSWANSADSILHANNFTREEAIQAFDDLVKGKGMPTGSTEIVYIYSAPGVIAGIAAVAIEAGVPVAIVESATISAGSNGTYQLVTKPLDQFNLTDFTLSAVTGAATTNSGIVGSSMSGGISGFISSLIKGDNPIPSAVGGAVGGGGGAIINNVAGPIVGGITSEVISDKVSNNVSDGIKNINDNNQNENK